MSGTIFIELNVNGHHVARSIDARTRLTEFLRDDLELLATKVGCEEGICGSCTVLVDGVTARACLVLAAQVDGCEVTTLEGRQREPIVAALQEQFVEKNASQCGFCTAGMLATAAELLCEGSVVSREVIRNRISSNLCRCTGYQSIVDAIEVVAGAK